MSAKKFGSELKFQKTPDEDFECLSEKSEEQLADEGILDSATAENLEDYLQLQQE